MTKLICDAISVVFQLQSQQQSLCGQKSTSFVYDRALVGNWRNWHLPVNFQGLKSSFSFSSIQIQDSCEGSEMVPETSTTSIAAEKEGQIPWTAKVQEDIKECFSLKK